MHTTSKPSLSAAVSSNPQDYFLLENHRDSIQLFFCWTTFVVPFRKLQKNFLSFIAIEFQMVRCAVWSRALLKNIILAQQTFCGWTDVKKRPSSPPPLLCSYPICGILILWCVHLVICKVMVEDWEVCVCVAGEGTHTLSIPLFKNLASIMAEFDTTLLSAPVNFVLTASL